MERLPMVLLGSLLSSCALGSKACLQLECWCCGIETSMLPGPHEAMGTVKRHVCQKKAITQGLVVRVWPGGNPALAPKLSFIVCCCSPAVTVYRCVRVDVACLTVTTERAWSWHFDCAEVNTCMCENMLQGQKSQLRITSGPRQSSATRAGSHTGPVCDFAGGALVPKA